MGYANASHGGQHGFDYYIGNGYKHGDSHGNDWGHEFADHVTASSTYGNGYNNYGSNYGSNYNFEYSNVSYGDNQHHHAHIWGYDSVQPQKTGYDAVANGLIRDQLCAANTGAIN